MPPTKPGGRIRVYPPMAKPRMGYISQTLPGISRGPHAHREQTDYFVFLGPGDFKLFLWDPREDSPSAGKKQVVVVGQSNPQSALVPPEVVHGYKNISDVPGLVLNFPDRLYAGEGKREPVDEIRYEDVDDHPYVME